MTDAVVLWVDGSDPSHREKRLRHASEAGPHARRGNDETRFADAGELWFALHLIRKNAPWIRVIHLVTDAQRPSWLTGGKADALGVNVVDHSTLYRGAEHLLPIFNSRALESMLHRIPGLGSRFVYFNDDFFLIHATREADYFAPLPRLRGRVRPGGPSPLGELVEEIRGQIAFRLPVSYRDGYVGPAAERRLISPAMPALFALAHAPVPVERDRLAGAMTAFDGLANAAYRFRSDRQYVPLALLAGLAIHDGTALAGPEDWEYIHAGKHTRRVITHRLARCREDARIKSLCVQSLERAAPETRALIVDYLESALSRP